MKKILQGLGIGFFLLFIFSFGNVYAATISSTYTGGSWSSTGTWVGGVIPGQYDDVIIDGIVNIGGNSAHNITILSGATLNVNGTSHIYGNLQNNGNLQASYHNSLNVYGNTSNNGNLKNGSYQLSIFLYGNIQNNGTWSNSYTYLKGENSTKNITTSQSIGGNVYLDDNNINITGNPTFSGTFYFNGKKLKLENNISTTNLSGNGEISGSGGSIEVSSSSTATFTGSLQQLKITGNPVTLYGNLKINTLLINSGATLNINEKSNIYGNLQNNGNLQASYHNSLNVYGNTINNGNLKNGNYQLSIFLYGNIQNNGTWNNSYTYLSWPAISGTGNYYINILGYTGASISNNQYQLPNTVLNNYSNLLWTVNKNGVTTPAKCINVPGCILEN